MKKHLHVIGCIILAAVAFLYSFESRAQDAPPEGGFKNPYLTVNKSGNVTLTYSRWNELVGKGKYTLVFFWASWSDESREEAANVQAIYHQYAGKRLDVLGVPYGDEISDSMAAMTEWGIRYPQIVDVEDDIAGQFGFDSVPFIVLLGPSRETLATGLRGDAIREAVEKYVR